MNDKQILRKELFDLRQSIPLEMIIMKSRHIQALLFSVEAYHYARCVGFYVSSGHEVDTHLMIHDCFKLGKRVVVPKCGEKAGEMMLCEIDSFNDMVPGTLGILEPYNPVNKISLDEVDVLVVPGVGFDRGGHRIGQGGGYYDTLLSLHPRGVVIGIAFSIQLVDVVPIELHDKSVDLIVTENEVIDCGKEL
jgi:5-formyltetrahydrofolate cyclo-ligase